LRETRSVVDRRNHVCFEMGAHCVAQAGLEFVHLGDPPASARTTGVHHHAWLKRNNFFFPPVLRIEPRASLILGKCPARQDNRAWYNELNSKSSREGFDCSQQKETLTYVRVCQLTWAAHIPRTHENDTSHPVNMHSCYVLTTNLTIIFFQLWIFYRELPQPFTQLQSPFCDQLASFWSISQKIRNWTEGVVPLCSTCLTSARSWVQIPLPPKKATMTPYY
jgi:hypothetical protein